MLKVLITGPESSGKTKLVQYLARQYQVPWVPEFARTYLSALDRPYTEEDLLLILNGQLRLQGQYQDYPILFCDTGPEVIWVWSALKFGHVDTYIEQQVEAIHYDLRLLCYPDLDWEPDPLREAADPQERQRIFTTYVELFERIGQPFFVVKGIGAAREQAALKIVQELWNRTRHH